MPSDPTNGDSGRRAPRELFAAPFDGSRDRGYDGDPDEPDAPYGPGDGYYDMDEPPRRGGGVARTLLKGGVAVLAAGIFVGVVWYAYLWAPGGGADDGELPVVQLDDGPEKVRPDDPGGMEVPHRDSLLLNERGAEDGTTRVERLLPPPETPQPPEPLEDAGVSADPAPTAEATNGDAEAPGEEPAFEMPETPAAPSDQTDLAALPEDAADPAEVAETGAIDPDAVPLPGRLPERRGAAPDRAETPAPESGTEDVQTAQAGSGFLVQLAAFRSEEAARDGWRNLQEAHSPILGERQLSLQQAEIEGQGTFWRVRTGPFPNRATAEDICAQLEARDQGCLVVSP